MKIVSCTRAYTIPMMNILNHEIKHGTSLYEYHEKTLADMELWFEAKEKNNFPIVGIVDDNDHLLAFGSFGVFRPFAAYRYTVENSIYVDQNHRNKGFGKAILKRLIEIAQADGYHCMIAGIDSENLPSIQLHKSFGYEFCGKIKQAGYKFNRWLDVEFYQLIFRTPANPQS